MTETKSRHTFRSDLPISDRELEVLRMIAKGYTDRDIAPLLGITPKTAHTHAQHVLKRLGATTRARAVAIAYEQGLLP